jgi:hypothetical protein
MAPLVRRFVTTLLLAAGALALVAVPAAPAGASKPPGPPTTPSAPATPTATSTTTIPAAFVQTAGVVLNEDALMFSGDVLANLPSNQAPLFFLRLAPGNAAIRCRYSGTVGQGKKYDGTVKAFAITCRAGELPTLYGPTLEMHTAKTTSVFVPVTLINQTNGHIAAILPLLAGGVAAILTVAWGCWRTRVLRLRRWKQMKAGFKTDVLADVAWSASDSWATSVGGVGAILTAVIAGTSSLSNFVPGAPVGRMVVLNIVFAGLLALAPLIYGNLANPSAPAKPEEADRAGPGAQIGITLQEGRDLAVGAVVMNPAAAPSASKSSGTVGGVVLASATSLTAIYGELITMAFLVHLSTANTAVRTLLYFALGVGTVVAVFYAKRSIKELMTAKDAPISTLTHRGRVSAIL